MATDDFRRLRRGYVDVAELLHTFRLVSKLWQRIAEEKIDRDFESDVLVFHDGRDISYWDAEARKERRALVSRAIFLLNVTNVGDYACNHAVNLVVVAISEGVLNIDRQAFEYCSSLTTVSFPTTLTSIGGQYFYGCPSLDNVDLLHTNLQELGGWAFARCSELKSMTIPDSLQTFGLHIFEGCFKLVSFSIGVSEDNNHDASSEVVFHLRTQQRFAALEKMLAVVGFVHIEMLLVLREVCKEWNNVVIERVDEGVESGAMMVHGGKGVNDEVAETREERQELITQVIFLLNIVQIGENACWNACWNTGWNAINIVVVDIPEGIKWIGESAFFYCRCLTTVSFPRTLTPIGEFAFSGCNSLDNVDLLHTNLQELGEEAFSGCSELTSMTIPDSLQTLGDYAFWKCYMLVPSIDDDLNSNTVVAHLRSLQN